MTRRFVDAVFYVALLLPRDQHRTQALAFAAASADDDESITSEPVLVEVLATFAGGGIELRRRAVELIDSLRADPQTTIVPQTPELFAAGLDMYRRRPDKGYSLTDCMSMEICNQLDIAEVLTRDRHFAQEGFAILL